MGQEEHPEGGGHPVGEGQREHSEVTGDFGRQLLLVHATCCLRDTQNDDTCLLSLQDPGLCVNKDSENGGSRFGADHL